MQNYLQKKRSRAMLSLLIIALLAVLMLGAMIFTLVRVHLPLWAFAAFMYVSYRLYVQFRRAVLVTLFNLTAAQLAEATVKLYGEDGWRKPAGEGRPCSGP